MRKKKALWVREFATNDFLMIAGPCSAESEQQVMNTALALEKISGVSVFRAGLWKPRTRPGSFEGVGREGFHWLKSVKDKTRLRIAVEVASPRHVEECLKNGIDLIWIGARTTSNPFSVEELARSMAGTNAAVLIKNPLHTDLNLWLGAIERLHKAGLNRIGAIHRGFFPYSYSVTRNIPRWDLLIELRRIMPELPVIADPSHIAGNTKMIPKLAQDAIDLDVQGLMIEVHSNPKQALSDSGQQLSPAAFFKLTEKLNFRKSSDSKNDTEKELQAFRSQIDVIDQQLFEFLSQRMEIAKGIGNFKCRNEITILQLKRWEEILTTRMKWGKQYGLSEEFTKKILQLIHEEAIKVQSKVMNQCKDRTSGDD